MCNNFWRFGGIHLSSDLLGRNDVGSNQACTLFGAGPGQNSISGTEYIAAGYGLDPKDIWRRNFPILVGFFIAFQLTQIAALEFYPVSLYTKVEDGSDGHHIAIRLEPRVQHLCERDRRDQAIERQTEREKRGQS